MIDSEGSKSDRKEVVFDTSNINTAVKPEHWILYY